MSWVRRTTIIQPMLYEPSKVGLHCSFIEIASDAEHPQCQTGKKAHIKAQKSTIPRFHQPREDREFSKYNSVWFDHTIYKYFCVTL